MKSSSNQVKDTSDEFHAHVNRRKVLSALSEGSLGIMGVNILSHSAIGQGNEGVPIVHTRDVNGEPAKVRMVPKERRRRINVYANLDSKDFIDEHPVVNEITLNQNSSSEEDLSIHLYLDDDSQSIRQRLPSRIDGVPVTFEKRRTGFEGAGGCQDPDNGARRCDDHYYLEGGIQIGANEGGWGTLCLVAYDATYGYKKTITAHHVMEENTDNTIYQPARYCTNDEKVGLYATHDSADDIWSADMYESSVSGGVGATVDALPDITGYWTYAGIADYTTTNSIYCHMAGAESSIREGYAVDTSKGGYVEHEVDYGDENGEKGDSGSPYVDPDGKLVSMYNGCQWAWGDHWDVGTAGDYVLSAVNASLS